MYEELTVKDIVLSNKINGLMYELIDTIDKYIEKNMKQFSSAINGDSRDINLACITAVFNTLISIVAEDIDRKVVSPAIIQELQQDFPIKVNNKLEYLKKIPKELQ
jgi:hypothetical protein